MKQTAVEFLFNAVYRDMPYAELLGLIAQARIMEKQQKGYSEEDMEIIEISSIDANYIPHYQTKEGQLLATKFNVKQFKKK